jgi:hypothetical protein
MKKQKYFVVVTYGITLTLTRRAITITRFLIYFTYNKLTRHENEAWFDFFFNIVSDKPLIQGSPRVCRQRDSCAQGYTIVNTYQWMANPSHTLPGTSRTPQTTILKGILTGGREIRRVIGQTEVNFVCAGRKETIACLVPEAVALRNTSCTGPR